MIDARELRLGDYVYLQNSKTPYLITEIGYSEIEYPRYEVRGKSSQAVVRTYIENLKPILLNEEVLLRCGFEKRQFGSAMVYYHPLIELDAHFCLNGVDYNIPVHGLHQLQNIYFDLTGKELEINLN